MVSDEELLFSLQTLEGPNTAKLEAENTKLTKTVEKLQDVLDNTIACHDATTQSLRDTIQTERQLVAKQKEQLDVVRQEKEELRTLLDRYRQAVAKVGSKRKASTLNLPPPPTKKPCAPTPPAQISSAPTPTVSSMTFSQPKSILGMTILPLSEPTTAAAVRSEKKPVIQTGASRLWFDDDKV